MAQEGTKENPWKLKIPPLTSDYVMYKDVKDGKEVIVCVVGKKATGLEEGTHDDKGNKMRAR
jgi:hypothetical protein